MHVNWAIKTHDFTLWVEILTAMNASVWKFLSPRFLHRVVQCESIKVLKERIVSIFRAETYFYPVVGGNKLHWWVGELSTLNLVAAVCISTLADLSVCHNYRGFQRKRRRQLVPPKCRYLSTRLYGVSTGKKMIFIVIDFRISKSHKNAGVFLKLTVLYITNTAWLTFCW
jgi:hypothetical protein